MVAVVEQGTQGKRSQHGGHARQWPPELPILDFFLRGLCAVWAVKRP
jgi:hypothetical protein